VEGHGGRSRMPGDRCGATTRGRLAGRETERSSGSGRRPGEPPPAPPPAGGRRLAGSRPRRLAVPAPSSSSDVGEHEVAEIGTKSTTLSER
jgi:hypothetical protein